MIIVGTHVDLIPAKERSQTCEYLKNVIQSHYCIGLPYYPTIKAIKFVSCPPTLSKNDIEVIKSLRKHLYTVASSILVTAG